MTSHHKCPPMNTLPYIQFPVRGCQLTTKVGFFFCVADSSSITWYCSCSWFPRVKVQARGFGQKEFIPPHCAVVTHGDGEERVDQSPQTPAQWDRREKKPPAVLCGSLSQKQSPLSELKPPHGVRGQSARSLQRNALQEAATIILDISVQHGVKRKRLSQVTVFMTEEKL